MVIVAEVAVEAVTIGEHPVLFISGDIPELLYGLTKQSDTSDDLNFDKTEYRGGKMSNKECKKG